MQTERTSVYQIKQVPRGSPVLIVTCVSSRKQNPHHRDQRLGIKFELRSHKIKFVGSYQYTGKRYNPEWIIPVIERALELGAEYLVFESADRILRNPDFNCSYNFDATASANQFLELEEYLQGIKLAVLIPPETSASMVRSLQRKRGLKKQYKKYTDEDYFRVKELREQGYSYRQISTHLDIPYRTVGRWIKELNWGVPIIQANKN